jgi:hypothetical protein
MRNLHVAVVPIYRSAQAATALLPAAAVAPTACE